MRNSMSAADPKGSTQLHVFSPEESGVIYFNHQDLSSKTTMGRKISNLTPSIGKVIGDCLFAAGLVVLASSIAILIARGAIEPRTALIIALGGAASSVVGLKLNRVAADQKRINEGIQFLLNKSSIDKDVNQLINALKVFKMSSYSKEQLTQKESRALELIQREIDKVFIERINQPYSSIITQSLSPVLDEKNGSKRLGDIAKYPSEIVRMSTVVSPQTLQGLNDAAKASLSLLKNDVKVIKKTASAAE